MQCRECEDRPGERMTVVYTDGTSEALALCEQCRRAFAEGNFVDEVTPIELD